MVQGGQNIKISNMNLLPIVHMGIHAYMADYINIKYSTKSDFVYSCRMFDFQLTSCSEGYKNTDLLNVNDDN